ncbi:motile sperm domain-containing protein 2-like [Gadus macrocephalus]|uniref:motile sperm domain-containing protein 2-like n=1 Tax=Gadus macrocephalus TaxID=80720 RepID=UPI0028CB7B1F|nr:motile sperm domain-containing protein 2-like [Gadus macrocephalus]
MAAEMENNGTQDLAQFWKEVPRANIVEHRLRCHVMESAKPPLSPPGDGPLETGANGQQDLSTTLMRVMASNARLEQKLDSCLWVQKVLLGLMVLLLALIVQVLYRDGPPEQGS